MQGWHFWPEWQSSLNVHCRCGIPTSTPIACGLSGQAACSGHLDDSGSFSRVHATSFGQKGVKCSGNSLAVLTDQSILIWIKTIFYQKWRRSHCLSGFCLWRLVASQSYSWVAKESCWVLHVSYVLSEDVAKALVAFYSLLKLHCFCRCMRTLMRVTMAVIPITRNTTPNLCSSTHYTDKYLYYLLGRSAPPFVQYKLCQELTAPFCHIQMLQVWMKLLSGRSPHGADNPMVMEFPLTTRRRKMCNWRFTLPSIGALRTTWLSSNWISSLSGIGSKTAMRLTDFGYFRFHNLWGIPFPPTQV